MRAVRTFTFLVAVAIVPWSYAKEPGEGPGPQLGHMVFFELVENTPAAREKLAAACTKHLSGHEGTVYFSVGTLAEEYQREVNDRGFHVALHLVFKSKAAHDKYQTHERHLKFIEENKDLWKKVRVFDSYLAPPPPKAKKGEETAAEKLALPDAASSFAGMIKAKVVAKQKGGIVVQVEGIEQSWEHSKAQDAKALVGKKVLVLPHKGDGGEAKNAARFLKVVKVGESVSLDVAHKDGEALTLLELTEEQRARARDRDEL